MNVTNRDFFVAAGESLRQAEAWHQSVLAGLAAARAWCKELGAIEVSYDRRSGSLAMKFDGPAPKGWAKHPRDRAWHIPSEARSPEAKAVRERRDSMRPEGVPGETHFGYDDSGFNWHSPSLERIGDKWVISQHRECKTPPPDAIPIKRSEYMAMLEAQEAAGSKEAGA